ncbi:hypothetical protein CDD83_852 [Cordyceps sp. RAO-2017]|nr:hypothetical protein CDD83_852 [Cordyceps sp. RAO-2017]
MPWNGSFFFWFRANLLAYRTELKDSGTRKEEEISITCLCLSRSSRVLKDLLEECREEYLRQLENNTTIYENNGDSWVKVVTKPIRPLSTVIFKQKDALLEDIQGFLDPQTQDWFARRAIPYRRGYLLYGPPGTGKSSFCLSIAGELDLDIYTVNISTVNDQALKKLFSKLPQKCAILLEDIDAVGTSRAFMVGDESSGPRWPGTLSGLLNTLDGVTSHEGRILIMTTNHREKLDEALIRPGRIDMQAEFQLADARTTAQIFKLVFEDGKPTTEEKMLAIERAATEFSRKVMENRYSPAEIISYLLRYRNSPAAALSYVDEWIAAPLRDRGQKSRSLSPEAVP